MIRSKIMKIIKNTGCCRKKMHKVYHVINVEPFVLELQSASKCAVDRVETAVN